MIKAQNALLTCPVLNFSIELFFVLEDIVEHVRLHANKYHNNRLIRVNYFQHFLLT
jgi:hypothetical protein